MIVTVRGSEGSGSSAISLCEPPRPEFTSGGTWFHDILVFSFPALGGWLIDHSTRTCPDRRCRGSVDRAHIQPAAPLSSRITPHHAPLRPVYPMLNIFVVLSPINRFLYVGYGASMKPDAGPR